MWSGYALPDCVYPHGVERCLALAVELVPVEIPERHRLAVEQAGPLAGKVHCLNQDFTMQLRQRSYRLREKVGPFEEHGTIYQRV